MAYFHFSHYMSLEKLRNYSNESTQAVAVQNTIHYENMPIQIYRKFHLQKLKISR